MASKNKPALIVSAVGWAMQIVLLIVEALREVGWSDEEIHTLGTKRGYEDLKRGVHAFADALSRGVTFTLSTANASMPEEWRKERWKVAEHRPLADGEITITFRDGEMFVDGVHVVEHLSPEQERGDWIKGDKLQKELVNLPTLPDAILDLLIREQDNPEVAAFLARFEGRYPFFWGTVYETPGGSRYVRFLYRNDGRWDGSRHWLGNVWRRSYPALVLAHPLGA